MVGEMDGAEAVVKYKTIPLSDDTIKRRIAEINDDVEMQLINRINSSDYFSIQLDESTDNTNKALLLMYVRYCSNEKMHSDLLFCRELPNRTTSDEVMRCICSFFHLIQLTGKDGVCTDGAASMAGVSNGVFAQIKELAPSAEWTHCYLHRENLAAKNITSALKAVISISIKTVNYIKNNATNSRCFAELCVFLESEHAQLLYHCEVRWLSKGRVLTRLFELRQEVKQFLESKNHEYASFYSNEDHLAKLAYLADVYDNLNVLKTSMQGVKPTVFELSGKIEGFKKKVSMWARKVEERNIQMFHLLSEYIEDKPEVNILAEVSDHLKLLLSKLHHYFPEDLRKGYLWVLNPFSNSSEEDVDLPLDTHMQLLQLSEDSSMKSLFNMNELPEFWLYAKAEYPALALCALKFLVPFRTTYLCESGFSSVTDIKTKKRNRIATVLLSACLRLFFTDIEPRWDELLNKKQAHVSH